MGGITRIQNSREESQRSGPSDGTPNKEIWLKDGDQVFLTSVATGDENDNLLDLPQVRFLDICPQCYPL